MIRLIAITLALCVSFTFAQARTWNIEPDGSGDAPTIQAGIDSAAVGDTVLVHDGIYTGPGNMDLEVGGNNICLFSQNGPESTIIDCEGNGRGIYIYPGSGDPTVIHGFTIRNGSATRGGGIHIKSAHTLIRDCHIHECSAESGGGGIAIDDTYSVRIRKCFIAGNTAMSGGGILVGGVYAHAIIDTCVVIGNLASGTGLSSGGGGIALGTNENYANVNDCTIAGNRAISKGGGLALPSSGGINAFMEVWASIIWGNHAEDGGQIHARNPVQFYLCDIDTTGVWGDTSFEFCVYQDPLHCDPDNPLNAPTTSGDYTLDAASPSLPENNPVGPYTIGALGQGCDVVTMVADGGSLPSRALGLFVSPNPSTSGVTLRYSLPTAAHSSIHVYDIRGRVVCSFTAPGSTGQLRWDGLTHAGDRAAPGVYFVRMTGGAETATKRVTLVR